ncbi:MAG: HAD hydrolase-like protein [Acidobacteriota bacterium]|nr:HAD hydrolase-like protein [Acidobacteriota bacterium]
MPDSKQVQNPKPEIQNLKILLWDIDGTLISSTVLGAFKTYFAPVMREIYGSVGKLDDLKVSGMTDTQIFYEALKDEGFTPEQILAPIKTLLPAFKKAMTKAIAKTKTPFEIKPGVREILEATSKNPHYLNALLTGNLSVAAEIKLEYFDLWKYFADKPNIFGEISHDRRELGKAAVETIGKFLSAKFKPEQFIVIGDTPNDIAAARAFGAKMVSVATGRKNPKEELVKYKPDVVVDDLSDTKEILHIFETI